MIIELRNDLTSDTLENFRRLCTNVKKASGKGMPFVYKGVYGTNEAHHLIPKGHIAITNDGMNGTCIYRSHYGDFQDQMPQVWSDVLLN